MLNLVIFSHNIAILDTPIVRITPPIFFFQDRKLLFYRPIYTYILVMCINLDFDFLINFFKRYQFYCKIFHIHCRYSSFLWIGRLSVYKFKVDKWIIDTVQTKENLVCCHISSFSFV